MSRRGFTLTEVVVATVLVQLCLLGAMATLVHASRLSRRAARIEARAHAVELIADSLLTGSVSGPGVRVVGADTVRWTVRDAHSMLLVVSGRVVRDTLVVPTGGWPGV